MMVSRWFLPVGLAVACGTACANGDAASDDRVIGSDSLAAAVLVDLSVFDRTIELEPRYATSDNFTGAVLPGYTAPRVWLRRAVAEALGKAQARLQVDGLGLKVFDGYRPVRATLGMVDWAEAAGRVDLLDDGYIARESRHNLGVAVDLTIVDLTTSSELDMGTPYDTFDERAHTMNADGAVLENRLRLKTVLEAEGFRNYDQEWWHYSFPIDGAVAFDLPITDRLPDDEG